MRKLHLRPPFGRLPRRAPPGGSSYRSHLLRGLAAGPVAIAPRTVQFPLAFGTPPCLGCRDCDVASPRVGLLSPVPLRSCDPDGSRTSTRGIISPPVGGGKIPPGRGVRGPPRGGPPGGPPGPPGAPRARARGPGARGPPGGAPGTGSSLPPGAPLGPPILAILGGFRGPDILFLPILRGVFWGGLGGSQGGYTRGVWCTMGGGFCPRWRKNRKNRKSILSRLGELLNTLENVHPRGPRTASPHGPVSPRGSGSPPPTWSGLFRIL